MFPGHGRSSSLAPRGVLDDHPVGDPFDRGAVVRPGALRLVGHRLEAAPQQLPQRLELLWHRLISRLQRPVGRQQDLVEAECRPDRHRRELVGQRPRDPVQEARVPRHGRDIEREDPTRFEPLPREPEELPRREVERHVGLVVGVDDDQVVALVRAAEERPGIGVVHGQARVVLEPEVAAAGPADRRIELDAVDARLGIEHPERPRSRAGRVAEDCNRAQRPVEQRRQCQERVPDPAGEHRVAAPDRVNGDALVQAQQPLAVGTLDDLDELVERVLLVQEARLGLDRTRWNGDERRDRRREHDHPPTEQEGGGEREQRRRAEQGALGPGERDRDQRGHEGAEQRPCGREGVEAARDRTGRFDVGDRQPDREGRDHPEQHHGRREQEQDGEERSDHRAG